MPSTAKYLSEALAFLPEPHSSALRVLAHEPESAHVLDVILGLALSAKAPLDFIPANGETWDICKTNVWRMRDAAVAVAEDDPTKLIDQPTPFLNVLTGHLPTQYRRDLTLLTPGRAEHLEALARFVFGGPHPLLPGARQPYSEKTWMHKQISLLVKVQRLGGAAPASAPSKDAIVSISQAPSRNAAARAAPHASASKLPSRTPAGDAQGVSVGRASATHDRNVPPVGGCHPAQSSVSTAFVIPSPAPPAGSGQKRKKTPEAASSSGSNGPKRLKTGAALTATPKLADAPVVSTPSPATSSTSNALERFRSNRRWEEELNSKNSSTTSAGADKAALYAATSVAPFARHPHSLVNVYLTESSVTYKDWRDEEEDPDTFTTLDLNRLERAFMMDTRAERSNQARWTVALLPADSYRDAGGSSQYIFTLDKRASPQETIECCRARWEGDDPYALDVQEATEPAVRRFMAAFPRDIEVSYPSAADVTVLAKRGASAKEAGHIWFLDVGVLFGLRRPFSWWEAADVDHIHIVLDRTMPAPTLSIEIRRRSHARPTTFYAYGEEATVENYENIRSWHARRLKQQGTKSKFEMK